jgi:hypothetical protein
MMMTRRRMLSILLAGGPLAWAQKAAPPSPTRFQATIDKYLESDRTSPPPRGGILFTGSSIFFRWKTLGEQMAPLPAFNRAFGGSRTADILYYMDQVVLPYEPKIIVYYCGSNDVNAGEAAGPIAAGFEEFAARVHAKLPATKIYYVSINKPPQKRDRWDVVDAANRMVAEFTSRDQRRGFIDVNPALFDGEGKPRVELYLPDMLHFKDPAYEEFTRIVKPVIEREWLRGRVSP